MRAKKQLVFETVIESSFRSHEKKFQAFMRENVAEYRVNAEMITPDLGDPRAVFARIAFAILSANAPFDDSVKALDYALTCAGTASPKVLTQWKMIPAKARYLNEAWDKINNITPLRIAGDANLYRWQVTKLDCESWSSYRYRLQKMFKGLGIAKASFAVSLLYPLTADVACLDTWMQKVFLGNTSFKSLSKVTYETVEQRITKYARALNVSTFLAQWMIWDHARGGELEEAKTVNISSSD